MADLPYIIIAGPTATGKTAAAVELAEFIGGEIISADSMQVYKFMDIGTAKPCASEMKGIPHYLIDELFPDESYSAYIFKEKAGAYARDIRLRGKYPIICGGTGFYINALAGNTDFSHMEADTVLREELYAFAEKEGGLALHKRLAACDPQAAAAIHPNNIKRVVRAIEFFKQHGQPISAHNAKEKSRRAKAFGNSFVAALTMERDLLFRRIDNRVNTMVQAGLEAEVRGLLERGYSPELTSMQGLGYKEMVRYINGEYDLNHAIEAIKAGTRRFAKRQWTWFNGQIDTKALTWYNVADYDNSGALAEKIIKDMGKYD